MTRKLVIFGTGSMGATVRFYFDRDSDYEVVGFTASEPAIAEPGFDGLPLVPFERLNESHPPDEHDLFIAVGYRKMNRLRQQFCEDARGRGYRLASYLCSKATHWGDTQIGDNVFIFEDNTIQPFVKIGDGSVLWSGNHIGHHSTIGHYCFITSHVVISGVCSIGDRSFIGVNATISEATDIGADNIVGPATLIQKSTTDGQVHIAERTKPYPKDSSRFFR